MKIYTSFLLATGMLCVLCACSQTAGPPETEASSQQETVPPPSSIIDEKLRQYEEETSLPAETQEETYSFENGLEIQKVEDLITGDYLWQSVVEAGDVKYDKFGGEYRNYDVEPKYFETVNGKVRLTVRRWDNLQYSCGDYLIYEYGGTVYVAKPENLDLTVVSFPNYCQITKAGDYLMVDNALDYTITFYDYNFNLIKSLEGLRTAGTGDFNAFSEGLLPVEDPQTGKFGYLNTSGELEIPIQYDAADSFSNGCAGVLTGASQELYVEGGTAILHMARGGQWGIIDKTGKFVLEPSERTGNVAETEEEENLYGGATGFSPVRKDGSVDFIRRMDGTVIFTEKIDLRG